MVSRQVQSRPLAGVAHPSSGTSFKCSRASSNAAARLAWSGVSAWLMGCHASGLSMAAAAARSASAPVVSA
ncbi:hypothetical protein ACFOLD_07090 [Kocuria carniphila]|uniref:hypothetical protein n=1 Tax=Kocuria carniphila TaxID=262208 RepID=UPI00361F9716